jgi:hypothetical protein
MDEISIRPAGWMMGHLTSRHLLLYMIYTRMEIHPQKVQAV